MKWLNDFEVPTILQLHCSHFQTKKKNKSYGLTVNGQNKKEL